MTADVHALTGAYVLDAVSETERAAFERHLRECETCAQEVYELRETAARLGRAAAALPPPRLTGAVMARIRQVRQDPPQASVTSPRHRGTSWTLRLTSAAAAVLLVATGVLGVLLVQAQQATDESNAKAAAIATILGAGDAEVLTEPARDGGQMTMLASRSADRALLFAKDLPDLDPDQTYQAWAIGERPVPAGFLSGGTTQLEVDDIAAAGSIGITIEPAGGSDQPNTQELILQLELG